MKQRNTEQDALNNSLYEALLLLETPDECRDFLTDLCTPAELTALADRLEVAKMLLKDMSYRAISEKKGVSVTTVTRVARFLSHGSDGYQTIFKRMGLL